METKQNGIYEIRAHVENGRRVMSKDMCFFEHSYADAAICRARCIGLLDNIRPELDFNVCVYYVTDTSRKKVIPMED